MALTAWPTLARAQAGDIAFPAGVSGYDQQFGVTVRTRRRALYETPGVQVGDILIRPNLDQSVLYDSNPLGTGGSGSFLLRSSASVAAAALPSRDSLATTIGVDHYHYFSLPLDYTDFSVGIAAGHTIGENQLTAAYSHQAFHTLGTTIATTRSSSPILDQTDTARIAYQYDYYRISVTPELIASAYRFGNATSLGVTTSQRFLDRNVIAGGVTGRLATTADGGVVMALRVLDTQFISPQAGQPTNNSTSVFLLAGVDYQASGPWRYRLLVGAEIRAFQAAQYSTQISPVVTGDVIWTPTGVLTVNGIVSRTIDDPQSGGTNGFILTSAQIRADYELRRNILLQAHTGLQLAEFMQGAGTQTSFNAGAGVTWLLNRNVQLSFTYDYTQQSGSGALTGTSINTTAVASGQFTQSVAGVTLHLAL